jgi:hypothetical protein
MQLQRIEVAGNIQFDRLSFVELVGASNIQRVSAKKGSKLLDIPGYTVKLGMSTRHVVIHEVHDVNLWAQLNPQTPFGSEMIDVRVFNVGWKSTDPTDREDEAGGHGQGIYTQHFLSSDWNTIDTCVFIAGFSLPGKIYGSNRDIPIVGKQYLDPKNKLAKYKLKHSIFVGKFFLVGADNSMWGAHEVYFDDCAFADCTLRMGYEGQNGDGAITNSLLTRGLSVAADQVDNCLRDDDGKLYSWRNLEVTGNEFIIPADAKIQVQLPGKSWKWNNNHYRSANPRPFSVKLHLRDQRKTTPGVPGVVSLIPSYQARVDLSFEEWQALTGFDRDSTFTLELPSEPVIREYVVEGLGQPTTNRLSWSASGIHVPTLGAEVVCPTALPLNWRDGLVPPLYGHPNTYIERVVGGSSERIIAELQAQLQRKEGELALMTDRIARAGAILNERALDGLKGYES